MKKNMNEENVPVKKVNEDKTQLQKCRKPEMKRKGLKNMNKGKKSH